MIRALKIVKHSFDRFRADKLKQEWLRLLIAIVFSYFATVFMVAMQVSSDKRYEPAKYTALRDLLFDILPLVPINYRIVDLPFATTVLLLIMISRSVPRWLDVLIAVRRIYWIQSILVILRGICVISTVLPPPEWCHVELTGNTESVFVLWYKLATRQISTCTDSIFSGHASVFYSEFLYWLMYVKNVWVKAAMGLLLGSGLVYISLSRYHYTVDVVVALIVTYGVFSVYFMGVERAVLYRLQALPYGPNSTNKESQQQQQQKQQKQQQQQQQQQQKQQQQQQQIQQLDDANAEEMAIETTDEKNPTGSRQIMEHDKYMKLLSANYMLNDIVPQVIGWMDGIDLRC